MPSKGTQILPSVYELPDKEPFTEPNAPLTTLQEAVAFMYVPLLKDSKLSINVEVSFTSTGAHRVVNDLITLQLE